MVFKSCRSSVSAIGLEIDVSDSRAESRTIRKVTGNAAARTASVTMFNQYRACVFAEPLTGTADSIALLASTRSTKIVNADIAAPIQRMCSNVSVNCQASDEATSAICEKVSATMNASPE